VNTNIPDVRKQMFRFHSKLTAPIDALSEKILFVRQKKMTLLELANQLGLAKSIVLFLIVMVAALVILKLVISVLFPIIFVLGSSITIIVLTLIVANLLFKDKNMK
jgi:Flp pilus assembly protein TadB